MNWIKKCLLFIPFFKASKVGPPPTSPNSSPSSTEKSTTAPSTIERAEESKKNLPHEKLIGIAARELGKKETAGNNRGADVRKYQAATSLDPGAWPWCAAFVCWCIEQWMDDPEVRAWLGLKKSAPAAWRPKTALAFGFLKWASARPATVTVLPDTAEPKTGDIVIFDFSHIGFVTDPGPNGTILTIEGNTNGAGSREGDGVYLKVRRRSLARAFLRIHPSAA